MRASVMPQKKHACAVSGISASIIAIHVVVSCSGTAAPAAPEASLRIRYLLQTLIADKIFLGWIGSAAVFGF